MPVNLLDFDAESCARFVAELGEKPFRARQLLRWIHQLGVCDFAAMTDMPIALREKLAASAQVVAPRVLKESIAADGTVKWLLDVGTDNAIESVLIPEAARTTLCVSSQAGCALACTFCSTGRQGFNRDLSTAEIVGQLWFANRHLAATAPAEPRKISNVVMMGMGEPLANFDNVVAALKLMLDDHAYGLSRRRVTLSTAGMVPQIDHLREACPVALAVSLHAPNDALRDELVPINRKWPLDALLAACRRYLECAPRDFITFEYVMLDGVNDGVEQARELLRLVADVPCKINLIPFNGFAESGYRRSPAAAIARFRDTLMQGGLTVTVRKTRGDDIEAACGQLAGQIRRRGRKPGRALEAA